ncbi:GNAT family protein [Streptomyces sp. NPDC048295]|uniref:GNAT family N-acetyltransferase n=1 Tax=Streptomyces sp. NPDC048295 TaxID=3154617 RepID=UPI003442E2FF
MASEIRKAENPECVLPSGGMPLGAECGMTAPRDGRSSPDVRFERNRVSPPARGRGVATAACRTLSRWAPTATRSWVVLVAATENVASQRVAEQCGFVSEGTARSGGILFAGRTDSGCTPCRAHLPAFPAEQTTDNSWPAPNWRWKVIG